MSIWRGTALILEKSKLYKNGVVLRHPGTLKTVATPNNREDAMRYCRRNGYSWMNPVANVSESMLEERI